MQAARGAGELQFRPSEFTFSASPPWRLERLEGAQFLWHIFHTFAAAPHRRGSRQSCSISHDILSFASRLSGLQRLELKYLAFRPEGSGEP